MYGAIVNAPQSAPFTHIDDSSIKIHNFLFGGTFSYRGHESLRPFAHVLAGFSRRDIHGTEILTGSGGTLDIRFSNSETAFAAAAGGGLDVQLGKRLALRVVQADYLLTRLGGFTQNNARISTGLVFRFGEK